MPLERPLLARLRHPGVLEDALRIRVRLRRATAAASTSAAASAPRKGFTCNIIILSFSVPPMEEQILILINRDWTSPALDAIMAAMSSMQFWAVPLIVLAATSPFTAGSARGRCWWC